MASEPRDLPATGFPSTGITSIYHNTQLFHVPSGSWSSVSNLAWQVFSWLSYLPSPHQTLLFPRILCLCLALIPPDVYEAGSPLSDLCLNIFPEKPPWPSASGSRGPHTSLVYGQHAIVSLLKTLSRKQTERKEGKEFCLSCLDSLDPHM